MSAVFNNILIPVDFSINTEIAVKKANELIEDKMGVIHLMHVVYQPFFISLMSADPFFRDNTENYRHAEQEVLEKLTQWKNSIMDTLPGVVVRIHLLKGKDVQQQIVHLSKRISPQLIIIGKHNYHNWFGFLNTVIPGLLARTTNYPVLTIKTGSLHNKIKTIVFPVQPVVNNRKIDLLVTLVRKYRARIHLVIPASAANENESYLYRAFIDTYRTLKASLNCPIEYTMVPGNNIAKSALQFAELIKADMILVNPDTEPGLFMLRPQQVTDKVKGNSKLEVLAVQP